MCYYPRFTFISNKVAPTNGNLWYTVVFTISWSRDKYLIAYFEIDRPISEFRNGQRWRTSNLEIDFIPRLDVTAVTEAKLHHSEHRAITLQTDDHWRHSDGTYNFLSVDWAPFVYETPGTLQMSEHLLLKYPPMAMCYPLTINKPIFISNIIMVYYFLTIKNKMIMIYKCFMPTMYPWNLVPVCSNVFPNKPLMLNMWLYSCIWLL